MRSGSEAGFGLETALEPLVAKPKNARAPKATRKILNELFYWPLSQGVLLSFSASHCWFQSITFFPPSAYLAILFMRWLFGRQNENVNNYFYCNSARVFLSLRAASFTFHLPTATPSDLMINPRSSWTKQQLSFSVNCQRKLSSNVMKEPKRSVNYWTMSHSHQPKIVFIFSSLPSLACHCIVFFILFPPCF